jgi:uncharacterized protein YpmB
MMSKKVIAITVIVLVFLIICGGFGWWFWSKSKASSAERQAVFLTNGQVYFGYVDNPEAQIVHVRDIYYLKTQDLTNPGTDTNGQKKIALVKMGSELHGPTDEVYINRDQILFIETMKGDSKVNDAIAKYNQK